MLSDIIIESERARTFELESEAISWGFEDHCIPGIVADCCIEHPSSAGVIFGGPVDMSEPSA